MNPVDLETLVDRELSRLPPPRAPHTLLPRVLAAVQEWSQRPWYARAWLTWPLGGQVVSIAALLLLVTAGAMVLSSVQAAVGAAAASTLMTGVTTNVAAVLERVAMTTNGARILWRTLLEPLLPYAFALVVLMSLACAAFVTALNHVVLGRAVQR